MLLPLLGATTGYLHCYTACLGFTAEYPTVWIRYSEIRGKCTAKQAGIYILH